MYPNSAVLINAYNTYTHTTRKTNRMTKSALNQFTKCLSLEGARDNCFAIALHPGTVDTGLSIPFQKNVSNLLKSDMAAERCDIAL